MSVTAKKYKQVLQTIINKYCKLLSVLIAAALALMVVLVFGNVVMRYAFNSGLTVSEEQSRWLFVWVAVLGAIAAMNDGVHLGTDMLVSRLLAAQRGTCRSGRQPGTAQEKPHDRDAVLTC